MNAARIKCSFICISSLDSEKLKVPPNSYRRTICKPRPAVESFTLPSIHRPFDRTRRSLISRRSRTGRYGRTICKIVLHGFGIANCSTARLISPKPNRATRADNLQNCSMYRSPQSASPGPHIFLSFPLCPSP